MRDDDHGAVARVEHFLEPADGVDVEVVGRFVEQQDVGIGKQRLGEQHAQFPTGGDGTHRAAVLFSRNARAEQQFAGTRLGGVTVKFGEARFEIGGAHVIFFAGVGVGIDGIAVDHGLPHISVAHEHHVEHAHLFKTKLVLAQFAQTFVLVEHDVAATRIEVAAQNFHEGRLAAAVRTDQAVAVAIAEFDRDVFKKRLGAELHGDISGGQHGRTLSNGTAVELGKRR